MLPILDNITIRDSTYGTYEEGLLGNLGRKGTSEEGGACGTTVLRDLGLMRRDLGHMRRDLGHMRRDLGHMRRAPPPPNSIVSCR
eukprot:4932766-Pyramimonas_sp.AAC.1